MRELIMSKEDEIITIIEGILGFFIVVIVLIVMFSGIIHTLHKNDMWHDGYCKCGGQWIFEQALPHAEDTTFLYKCDKCGRRLEWGELH